MVRMSDLKDLTPKQLALDILRHPNFLQKVGQESHTTIIALAEASVTYLANPTYHNLTLWKNKMIEARSFQLEIVGK